MSAVTHRAPLGIGDRVFAILHEDKTGKSGRRTVRDCAQLTITRADGDSFTACVVASALIPTGHSFTLARAELFAAKSKEERAAFGALVAKLWGRS